MNKKTIFGIIGLVMMLGGAFIAYKLRPETKQLSFTNLNTFFVRNDVPLSETPNYFIIESKDEVDALFGVAYTMDTKPEDIDFQKEIVVAVALAPVNAETQIKINSVATNDNDLYIDYSITKGAETSHTSIPLALVKFERPNNALDLYFTEDGKIKDKIAFGNRTLSSPKTFKELKKICVGTFKGTLPCADCSGIETVLTINDDMTYKLSSTYLDKHTIPFVEEGTWTPSENLSMIELMQSRTYYFIYNTDTLELMSPDAKRINSELNYKLTKQ